MSYTFDGEIQIEPPLNFEEILKARDIALALIKKGFGSKYAKPENAFEDYMPFMMKIDEAMEATPRGMLSVQTASRLVPSRLEDGSLSYRMDALMDALVKALPGHQWKGEIIALDEERVNADKLVVDVSKGNLKGVVQVKGVTFIEWGNDSKPTPVSQVV